MKSGALQKWLGRAAIMLVATLFSVSLALLALPYLIPSDNERMANVDFGTIDFVVGMGDIFAYQPNTALPPADPWEVLSSHPLSWDENGFRVPARIAERYDIVALGDSFTEGANAAAPWPDVLAAELNQPVRNLGFRGYGSVESARAFESYGAPDDPDIVILGFFVNDITDAANSVWRADEYMLPGLARQGMDDIDPNDEPWVPSRPEGPFSYPMYVTFDVTDDWAPLAYLNGYISLMNLQPDTLRQSRNLVVITEALAGITAAAGDETCLIFANFPSKEQVYIPHTHPQHLDLLLRFARPQIVPDEGDFLDKQSDVEEGLTLETLMKRSNTIADVMGAVAADLGYHVVNLTPAFDEVAASGQMTYYAYDTHWNQAGHTLAGQSLADIIRGGICDEAPAGAG